MINNITLKPFLKAAIGEVAVEEALKRNWSLNDKDIHVKATGNKIALSGIVN